MKSGIFNKFIIYCLQLAAVAALCVQYEADFRPNMTIVVKALQPLFNSKPVQDHQIWLFCFFLSIFIIQFPDFIFLFIYFIIEWLISEKHEIEFLLLTIAEWWQEFDWGTSLHLDFCFYVCFDLNMKSIMQKIVECKDHNASTGIPN